MGKDKRPGLPLNSEDLAWNLARAEGMGISDKEFMEANGLKREDLDELRTFEAYKQEKLKQG